jgi:hypothetical protein
MLSLSRKISKASELRREIQRKVCEIGMVGTVRLGVSKLIGEMIAHFSSKRQGLHPFDLKYGTDTSGIIKSEALNIPDDRVAHAVRYQTAIVDVFLEILKSLPIVFEEYFFVDLGSGKGRALLLASQYPFKGIIGVEISAVLQTIACRNIHIYRDCGDELQRCHIIQSICDDATTCEIPKEKTVFYLYNPFDDYVMRAVLSNIENSFYEHPRDIYIAYLKPVHRVLFDKTSFLKISKETERYVIYQSKPIAS